MAPKKKEQQQKMSLGDFLTDGFGGGSSNWADEVEETYVSGTQPLPPSDRYRSGGGGSTSAWQDRGYSVRERSPTRLPDKPPFTAHLGNLSYDATSEAVSEFFEGCEVVSVRLIEDRELMRPKGFGYVEFQTLDGLKKALTLDGESFQNRMVKIKIADPPRGGNDRGGDSTRDLSDWSRKGPLPDLPGRSSRQPSDFGERRAPRDPAAEGGPPARERTWERRGPLSPVAQQEAFPREGRPARESPQGMGERSESYRGNRQPSATWGEGREEGSRPPRREFVERPERPERAPTAAEKDTQWRTRMKADAPATPSVEGSEAPSSPSADPAVPAQAAAPAGRPKLNLAKRTVSEAPDAVSPSAGSDAKASPFGAARPIDTATREKQLEEKRQQAVVEKREADEKAKEDRRLAKEAAAKAEAEKEAEKEAEPETVEAEAAREPKAEATEEANGASAEQKLPVRTREPREPREPKDPAQSPRPRAYEASSWRSASSEQRGGRGGGRGGRGGRGDGATRGARTEGRPPRANGNGTGSPAQAAPSSPTDDGEAAPVDADGWTTVPNKKARGGRLA